MADLGKPPAAIEVDRSTILVPHIEPDGVVVTQLRFPERSSHQGCADASPDPGRSGVETHDFNRPVGLEVGRRPSPAKAGIADCFTRDFGDQEDGEGIGELACLDLGSEGRSEVECHVFRSVVGLEGVGKCLGSQGGEEIAIGSTRLADRDGLAQAAIR